MGWAWRSKSGELRADGQLSESMLQIIKDIKASIIDGIIILFNRSGLFQAQEINLRHSGHNAKSHTIIVMYV